MYPCAHRFDIDCMGNMNVMLARDQVTTPGFDTILTDTKVILNARETEMRCLPSIRPPTLHFDTNPTDINLTYIIEYYEI